METALTDLTNIFVNVELTNFEAIIEFAATPLLANDDVAKIYPAEVVKREADFPTGLPTEPFGVAIPHTNPEFVFRNKVTIITLKKPITMKVMGSPSETVEVSILFLLALGESNKQLNVLQKLMKIMSNQDLLNRIKNGTKEEIYQIAKAEIKL